MGIVTGAVAAYLVGYVPIDRVIRHQAGGHPWSRWAELVGDAAKGVIAVLLFVPVGSLGGALTIAAVVAGDQWPLLGRDTGRPGIAVFVAAVTTLTPVALLAWGLFWAVGFVISGYFTIGTLIGTMLLPVSLGLMAGWPLGLCTVPACLLVVERQRLLLRTLLRGQAFKHYWRAGN